MKAITQFAPAIQMILLSQILNSKSYEGASPKFLAEHPTPDPFLRMKLEDQLFEEVFSFQFNLPHPQLPP